MDNMQTELRKHQHTLAVVGMGAIGFGIWSVIKAILYLTIINPLKDTVLADYENITDLEYEYLIALGVTIVITVLIVLIDLLDALELVMGFLGIIGVISSEEELLDSVSTLLVDLTSVVTLIEMVVAAVMIRKITEQLEAGQNTLQQSTEIQN